ncbi:MAG: hypothetical protein AB7K04_09195, partial [Pseudorhodoplanes sp.]
MSSAQRSAPSEWRPVTVRLLAYIGVLAALAAAAAAVLRMPGVAAASQTAPPAEWMSVERPHRAFDVSAPDFANADLAYAILRHRQGGGRKDILALGEVGRSAQAIVIEVYRPGSELASFLDAGTDIARRTSELHRVGPVRMLPPLDTKFGRVALFDFAIRPLHVQGRCAGFLRTSEPARVQIAGFLCTAQDQPVVRATIACARDTFTLLTAGGVAQLA